MLHLSIQDISFRYFNELFGVTRTEFVAV